MSESAAWTLTPGPPFNQPLPVPPPAPPVGGDSATWYTTFTVTGIIVKSPVWVRVYFSAQPSNTPATLDPTNYAFVIQYGPAHAIYTAYVDPSTDPDDLDYIDIFLTDRMANAGNYQLRITNLTSIEGATLV